MTSSEGPWPRTLAYQSRAPYLVLGGPDPSLPIPLPRRLGGSRTWSLQARTSGGPAGSAERRNRSGPTSSTGSSTPHTRPLIVCAPGDQAMGHSAHHTGNGNIRSQTPGMAQPRTGAPQEALSQVTADTGVPGTQILLRTHMPGDTQEVPLQHPGERGRSLEPCVTGHLPKSFEGRGT